MRRKLTEWLDVQGNKVTYNKSTSQPATSQAPASSVATLANNKKLWRNFVDAVTDFLGASGTEAYEINHYGGLISSVLDIAIVNPDGTEGTYYEFYFKMKTGKFKIKEGYDQDPSTEIASGEGFNNMIEEIKKINIDWFNGFDFNALKESLSAIHTEAVTNKSIRESIQLSTIDDFKRYENLWN